MKARILDMNSEERVHNLMHHPEHYEVDENDIIIAKQEEVNKMTRIKVTVKPTSSKTEPQSDFGREKIKNALAQVQASYPEIDIVIERANALTLKDIRVLKEQIKQLVIEAWIGE